VHTDPIAVFGANIHAVAAAHIHTHHQSHGAANVLPISCTDGRTEPPPFRKSKSTTDTRTKPRAYAPAVTAAVAPADSAADTGSNNYCSRFIDR
jgi:hypothetical protein